MNENELSEKAIGICIMIHKKYGPGLLESFYEDIFCYEWEKTGIPYSRQKCISLKHEEMVPRRAFRTDVILDNKLLLEFKSLESIPPVHFKIVRSYLKILNYRLALMLNFHVELFKKGIIRIPNNMEENPLYNQASRS